MTNDILQGPLAGKIIRFALPVAFTIICEQLVNNTDVLLLGNFVGSDAMAAVGNDTPVIAVLITLLFGLSMGTNVIMAQAVGAKDRKAMGNIVRTSIPFAFLIGALFTLIGELAMEPLIAVMGVPPTVADDAALYLHIYFIALPFLSLYNFEAALLRAVGDSQSSLYALMLTAVVNGALDYAAIMMGWGIAGVVWATVFAYAMDAAILFVVITRKKEIPSFKMSLSFDGTSLKRIIRIGLPAGLQGMVFAISNMVVQVAINSLGPEVMAASSAAFVIEINVYAVVNGFGQAATTFVGQSFGARDLKRSFLVTKKTMLTGCTVTTILCLTIGLFAEPILKLFTSDPEIIYYGVIRIYFATVLQILEELVEIFSGSLRGYGYSLPPALVAFFSICGIRLLWIFTVFQNSPSFINIVLCYPLSWLITGIILFFVYRNIQKILIRSYGSYMNG